MFAPPSQVYRVRSRFLASRQGKKKLSDYVQDLRTLLAAIQLNPLSEKVRVTIFMEGLRTGVSRTEVFRVHPLTFEEDVNVARNAEINFKAARYGTHGHPPTSFDKFEPMDLSYADDEKEQLQAVKHHRNIRRCYTCGSTKHLRPNFPSRKPLKNRLSRNTAPNQKPGTARERVDSQ